MTAVPARIPVLIVGGGPSGLSAAIELGRRGIDVIIVEPRTHLDPLRARAKTTSVRTMEHLRRWGLADRLRELAPLPVDYAQDVVFCTGLFGHEITRFPQRFRAVPRPAGDLRRVRPAGAAVGRRDRAAGGGPGTADRPDAHRVARGVGRRRPGRGDAR